MKGLLLVKEIYLQGFRNLGHIIIKNYFKIFSWMCFALIAWGIYALIYRSVTGFAFV